MTRIDKDYILKTLTTCTAVLNEEVTTGMSAVYVTIDRGRFNDLLKEIAEAKRMLVRPEAAPAMLPVKEFSLTYSNPTREL